MSRRTATLNRIFQSSPWANRLNARDRKHLRDLLDQAYRAGQWRMTQDASQGLQTQGLAGARSDGRSDS